jgi:hypothetical protein
MLAFFKTLKEEILSMEFSDEVSRATESLTEVG